MDGRTSKDGSDFNSEAESVYKSIPAGDRPKKQQKTKGPKKKRRWLRRLVIVVVAFVVLRAGCSLLDGGGSSASKKELSWPTAGLGATVPAPASLIGEIASDSSTRFDATITNTTPDDYDAYVASCMAAGFVNDYSRDGESFHGSDGNGAKVYVNYVGYNTMTITAQQDTSASTASAEEGSSTQENASAQDDASISANEGQEAAEATSTGNTTTNTSGVTPSFKEAMDSYEAFFDKYVQFMQKYKDDGYPASMLADYSSMMQQYADFTQKIDAIDESTLSAADDAYYITVTARIYQKLASVSQ